VLFLLIIRVSVRFRVGVSVMFRVSNFWNFFVEGGGAPVPWHNGTMAIPSLTYGATQNVLLD